MLLPYSFWIWSTGYVGFSDRSVDQTRFIIFIPCEELLSIIAVYPSI